MKSLIVILVLLTSSVAYAMTFDELEESYVTQATAFIQEYPLIDDDVDELGLVDLWQRIKGLHNLINIWDSNRAAYERPGADQLRSWYIHERIDSHRSAAMFNGPDDQTAALAELIRLHASFAGMYMSGNIKYGPYAEVASYAESAGRQLAEQVEKKYGNGKKILKPEEEITW